MLKDTIQLDISNATVEAPAKSELLDIGGYKWQIICPDDDSPDCFEIACNPYCTDRLWLCKAKYSIETKEGNSGWKKLEPAQSKYWFTSYARTVTRFKVNSQRTPNLIKVDIEVEWNASQSNLHPVDASLNMITDGTSELVPVNKLVLAAHSSYYHNFFIGPLATVSSGNDVNGNPIYDINEDPDFDCSLFCFMVHSFLCMGTMLDQLGDLKCTKDKEDKIALVKLAVKYNLLENFAEKELIKLGPGTMELLELADQFTLTALKHHCLENITIVEYCKDFEKNLAIREKLSPATKTELSAKLEENASKNWKIMYLILILEPDLQKIHLEHKNSLGTRMANLFVYLFAYLGRINIMHQIENMYLKILSSVVDIQYFLLGNLHESVNNPLNISEPTAFGISTLCRPLNGTIIFDG